MRLIEALQIAESARTREQVRRFPILTGFTPLHLATLLRARLQQRLPESRAELPEGLFGDLIGSIRRAASEPAQGAAVFVEWPDLDPRLGVRHASDWTPAVLPDIEETIRGALERLTAALTELAGTMPVVVSFPTLALPPVAITPGWQAGAFELRLRSFVATHAATLSAVPRIRLVSEQRLAELSPALSRRSVRREFATGFPYSHEHADALAEIVAQLLVAPSAKKGIITDLDDTLWSGILGEVGVAGVRWDLDSHAQAHGLYQQALAALAASGVLVAVVSKNDQALVDQAFALPELRLPRSSVFPVLASWNAKSGAITQVLEHWNVGADSVVFVDDSLLELAEVQSRFPEIECLRFPTGDPDAVLALLSRLRDLFGKQAVLEEDALRLESLRGSAEMRRLAADTQGGDHEAFLSALGATLTLRFGRDDRPRAFDLINKTNQYNVNGRRYTESEWRALLARDDTFVLTVDYADKFGRLGTIAVVTGVAGGGEVTVDRWVMSCRAFSRRIEHATLRALYDEFSADRVVLAFQPTERNGPAQEFLGSLTTLSGQPESILLSRAVFDAVSPPLYHTVERVSGTEYIHG